MEIFSKSVRGDPPSEIQEEAPKKVEVAWQVSLQLCVLLE